MNKAMMWTPLEDNYVECQLCSHRCKVASGKAGICKVRENKGGVLYATTYGKVSSMGPDPIEKKPLYHFMPGTRAYSFGSVGCNFRCDFCQNHSISQDYSLRGLRKIEPDEVPELAHKFRCQSVSWTYNEPTIWFEFTLDSGRHAKTAGLATTYVTNGYITEEALRELSGNLDAMNIDVKAFTEDFYKKRAKAKLQPVLDTCILALELGIFIELTYLVIPGQNDDPEEIRKFGKWVVDSLSPRVPVHFSRYHPDFRFKEAPRTPIETLKTAHRIVKEEGVEHVYIGNVSHLDEENTYCPECGTMAIERVGFLVSKNMTKDGKCGQCGADLNIIMSVDNL